MTAPGITCQTLGPVPDEARLDWEQRAGVVTGYRRRDLHRTSECWSPSEAEQAPSAALGQSIFAQEQVG
jgi:hypothetical protein